MGGVPELSQKEKVLLWLMGVEQEDEDPLGRTQAGISNSTGLSRGHTSRTLNALVKEGYLSEERVRATGFSRALKGYRVTPQGQEEYQRLSKTLMGTQVPVGTNGAALRPLKEMLPEGSRAMVLWQAMQRLWSEGRLDGDPDALLQVKRLPKFQWVLDQAPPRPSVFVGRAAQLETLSKWLSGQQGVFLVEAPGGTGKSSLLLEFVERSRPNRHVLWVRLTQWSDQERFVHELESFVRGLGRSVVPAKELTPEVLAEHFLRTLKGLPTLVVLDDVQKTDPVLLRTIIQLVQVAHRLPTLKVLLAGRVVDLGEHRIPEDQRLRLRPLERGEAEHLLAQRGVPREAQKRILEAAGGVPLFLDLLAQRSDVADGPLVSHDRLVSDLGAGLREADQELLCFASALRVPFRAEFLESAASSSRASLEALVQAGLLKHRPDDLYEMHDVVSSSVYERLPSRQRDRIHQVLAEAYCPPRRGRCPDGEGWLSRATEFLHHLVAAGNREAAVRWVLRNQTRILEETQRQFQVESVVAVEQ
jgi:DNA-binding PadR family transcriptional regulator